MDISEKLSIHAAPRVKEYPGFIHNGQDMPTPVLVGRVTSVTGSTLTVTPQRASTVYTVYAGRASITKANAPATLGDIAVGDTAVIFGTIDDTRVVAAKIGDSILDRPGLRRRGHKPHLNPEKSISGFFARAPGFF